MNDHQSGRGLSALPNKIRLIDRPPFIFPPQPEGPSKQVICPACRDSDIVQRGLFVKDAGNVLQG